MTFADLIFFAIGLAMDAFAVSVTAGLSAHHLSWKHYLWAGSWFGGFQFLMPVVGYFVAFGFSNFISSVDHWISFFLLLIIGINMIVESVRKDKELDTRSYDFGCMNMFLLAIATSVDALAAGVSFAFLKSPVWPSALLIGLVTFLLSCLGLKIGSVFGTRYRSWSGVFGGIVLILIGSKILIEDLFF